MFPENWSKSSGWLMLYKRKGDAVTYGSCRALRCIEGSGKSELIVRKILQIKDY